MWKRQKARDDFNYDALIKTALTGHLGEAVREVQRQQQQQQDHQAVASVVEGVSESAHTLCCVVEALFVHRLRDSFIDKVSSVFSGDVVRQPSPNFWPFLLAFSHRHTVDYLSDSCPWLRSDIGRCRGWIRLVLNDGMLTSYLELLAGERRLLNDFYDRQAYLRDPEHLDIARKLLSGIEMLQFRLAVNSSMLNNWSTTPLLLAGLWSPPTPLIREAVVQGVDAALCFTDEDETLQPIKKVAKQSAPAVSKVDGDLAFRLILESDRNIPSGMLVERSLESDASQLQDPPEPQPQPSQSPPVALPDANESPQDVLVTRLKLKSSRAASPTVIEDPVGAVAARSETPAPTESNEHFTTDVVAVEEAAADDIANTFEDLLEDYSNLHIVSASGNPSAELVRSEHPSPDSSSSPEEKFEVLSGDDKNNSRQSPFCSMLMTLNHERSLVKQNYQCAGCSGPIGLIYGAARVCHFTGGLYCPDCHCDDDAIIPARVFLNGDFSKRKICRAVQHYFHDIEHDAILESIRFDRNIYSYQTEFSALLTVRTQLQHISAFLLTCRNADAVDEFRKRTFGREHLYTHQHTYSMADLASMASNQLHQQLTKLFQFSKVHVATCTFCTMKGFLCEACRSDAVIFPFDLDSTFRCPFCGAVFHSDCMDRFKPCPRCERWKSKERAKQMEQLSDEPCQDN